MNLIYLVLFLIGIILFKLYNNVETYTIAYPNASNCYFDNYKSMWPGDGWDAQKIRDDAGGWHWISMCDDMLRVVHPPKKRGSVRKRKLGYETVDYANVPLPPWSLTYKATNENICKQLIGYDGPGLGYVPRKGWTSQTPDECKQSLVRHHVFNHNPRLDSNDPYTDDIGVKHTGFNAITETNLIKGREVIPKSTPVEISIAGNVLPIPMYDFLKTIGVLKRGGLENINHLEVNQRYMTVSLGIESSGLDTGDHIRPEIRIYDMDFKSVSGGMKPDTKQPGSGSPAWWKKEDEKQWWTDLKEKRYGHTAPIVTDFESVLEVYAYIWYIKFTHPELRLPEPILISNPHGSKIEHRGVVPPPPPPDRIRASDDKLRVRLTNSDIGDHESRKLLKIDPASRGCAQTTFANPSNVNIEGRDQFESNHRDKARWDNNTAGSSLLTQKVAYYEDNEMNFIDHRMTFVSDTILMITT